MCIKVCLKSWKIALSLVLLKLYGFKNVKGAKIIWLYESNTNSKARIRLGSKHKASLINHPKLPQTFIDIRIKNLWLKIKKVPLSEMIPQLTYVYNCTF